jgi:hypothetical protein
MRRVKRKLGQSTQGSTDVSPAGRNVLNGVRRLIAVALAVAVAGCGSSSDGNRTPSAPTQAIPLATTTTAASKPRLPRPCSQRARVSLAAATNVAPGSVEESKFSPPSGAGGCRLAAGGIEAAVSLDSAPQAYQRMEREAVEYGQEVVQTGKPGLAVPQAVKHLGLNAYWFPIQNRLLTTDGVRLVTIIVHADLDPAAKRDLATRLARSYLGPPRKPPGY